MFFEWDDAKSQRNLLERGFGFDHAAAIFIGPTLEAQDNRRDYGEVRVQAIGSAGDDILSVVYSDRGEVRRIISARLTNKKERKLWQSFIEHWSKSAEGSRRLTARESIRRRTRKFVATWSRTGKAMQATS